MDVETGMYEKTPKRVFSYMSPWFDFFTASEREVYQKTNRYSSYGTHEHLSCVVPADSMTSPAHGDYLHATHCRTDHDRISQSAK
jgi:hypothetical protein